MRDSGIARAAMRRLLAFVIAAAIGLTPSIAAAASCDDLAQERASIGRDARALASDSKGSTAVFVGCVTAGLNDYDRTKDGTDATESYAICAGIGCALTDDYANCLSVNIKLFAYALRDEDLATRMRDQSCRE
jgi:hypothetical protein